MDRYGAYDEDKHNAAGTGAGALQSAGADQGQLYRDEPQQQPEKMSVLKKVKAKAKKLKDNITNKHGHGQDELDRQSPSEEDQGYEDEDEDEEMEEGAELHGAPVYDSHQSATNQGITPSQAEGTGTTSERLPTPVNSSHNTRPGDSTNISRPDPDASRSFIPGQVGVSRHNDGVTFGGSKTPHTTVIATLDDQQQDHSSEAQKPSLGEGLERPHALEEDPRGPGRVHEPENYQSKVSDPSGMGGEEMGGDGATPVMQALNKMKIYDEPEQQGHQTLHTGSHDQFSPEPISAETSPFTQSPHTEQSQVHHDDEAAAKSTYMGKVSSATSVIVDKAAQAKNAVTSKLGYGGGVAGDQTTATTISSSPRETTVGEGEARAGGKGATASVGEYGKKVASTVYEKMAGAGNVVMSRVKTTTTPEEKQNQNQEGAVKLDADKGVSVKDYIVEKISPGEEDQALSEVITGAFPSIGGKQAGGEGGVEKVDPEGRVTMSATVAKRLGGGAEQKMGSENTAESPKSTGPGVVDKIKEAATGWFGKGGETQPGSKAFYDTNKKEEDDGAQGTARGASGEGNHSTRAVGEESRMQ